MSFEVSADAYARFMGRLSEPLANAFADQAGVRAGQRALDVGCGPGALTAVLVERLGVQCVAAVDPSQSFVRATRQRFPELEVVAGVAEDLPFPDASFDVALAQHFFNNYVVGAAKASELRAGTCLRVEKSYYTDLVGEAFTIYTTSDSPGSAQRIDNIETSTRAYPSSCTVDIPYSYAEGLIENTADVQTLVVQLAGVGKL